MSVSHRRASEQGSSLAVFAAVLVAIALGLGGAIFWHSTRMSADLRQTVGALERYQAAVSQFHEQFEWLPGDFPMATRVWGAARGALSTGYDAGCANHAIPSSDKRTCNGNGDGWPYDAYAAEHNQQYERFRFWQHLANAGMVQGHFTGIGGPHNRKTHHVAGVNSPMTPFADGVFVITSSSKANSDVSLWPHDPHLRLEMRSDYHRRYALLTPQQMQKIDEKMDDGKPGTGRITTYSPMRQPECTTASDAAQAGYNLARNDVTCSLIYFMKR